ncbi:MAG: hypothetical protein OEY97_09480 [Nitrospirota bacterium]|nr:hypothetical protein [Nitrospirota bacterium]
MSPPYSGLRAGTPLHAAGVWLIPVERVWLHQHIHEGRAWAAGGREPVAVVIRHPDGARALDLTGANLPMQPLLEHTDGLADALRTPPGK